MDVWHPRAISAPADAAHSGLPFIDVPWKLVVHTTEAQGLYRYDPSSYFGNPYWPIATIDAAGIHQHLPIDVGAYALAHSEWPETNRANAIQCEVMWTAADAPSIPDDVLANVVDWLTWCSEQTGAPLSPMATFLPYPASYGDNGVRFDGQEWLDFTGICGHMHVPGGNDHGDPGAIGDRLAEALNQEDPMADPQVVALLTEIRDDTRLIRQNVEGLGRQAGLVFAQLGVPTKDELGGDVNSGAKRAGEWADAEAAKAGIPRPTS